MDDQEAPLPRAVEPSERPKTSRLDRERVLRTLTFWLRPAFVLRALNRFQSVAGFDRAVALASSALTAIIPLTIIAGAILPKIGGKDAATRIIDRYDLTGEGANAVREVLAPATGTSLDISLLGVLFLLVALLSFTRGVQRMFEQTWDLPPMSVRNSANGLLWILGLSVYSFATGTIHGIFDTTRIELGANLLIAPLSAVFFVWSGVLLSAKRIPWRDLLPFGVLGAVMLAIYSTGAAVYVPHLFSSYATRYGVIGAVFAMISALFCVMVVLVASSAAGREVDVELKRIRAGERPPDDEIREQWDALLAEAHSRWSTVRAEVDRRRAARRERTTGDAAGDAADAADAPEPDLEPVER